MGVGLGAELRLCRRQPRNRDARPRTGHVIQPDVVAETNRLGVAPLFPADADLQVATLLSAALDRHLDQFADAFGVEDFERVVL